MCELGELINCEVFRNIAEEIITDKWLSLSDTEALSKYTDRLPVNVEDYKYLSDLKKQYPRLNENVKFMKSTRGSWPTHYDSHRQCAINIPIFNTTSTITRFYSGGRAVDSVNAEFGSTTNTWYSNEYLTYIIEAQPEFDHVLTVPTLINTSVPHGIFNNSDNHRIICSWAYDGTFEEAVGEFSEQQLSS